MDLLATYNNNIDSIQQRINDIYQEAKQFLDSDDEEDLNLYKIDTSLSEMDRDMYLQSVKCIITLQDVMNRLIGACNENGIIDYNKGDTDLLTLWIPRQLPINNEYIEKLNNNFKQCNSVLDSIVEFLKPFNGL